MKKLMVLAAISAAMLILITSCNSSSSNESTSVKENILKDSLQGFLNTFSEDKPSEETFHVTSVNIINAWDTAEELNTYGPVAESFITWNFQLIVKKEFNTGSVADRVSKALAANRGFGNDYLGHNGYPREATPFFKQIDGKTFKVGETITVKGLHALLVRDNHSYQDKIPTKLACWILFDNVDSIYK